MAEQRRAARRAGSRRCPTTATASSPRATRPASASSRYRVATLGYDAVLLTLRIARDWQPGRDFPTGRMLADDGFLGLDGPFRFGSNGVGERAMEVREVGDGTRHRGRPGADAVLTAPG